jgi:hypothetical protein
MLNTVHHGCVGCGMNDALVGTACAMPGQGIKDQIVDEFGEKLATSESVEAQFSDNYPNR